MKKEFFGKQVSPFTIPSGIVTTTTDTLKLIADSVPEVGILTTKSIGLNPRDGNAEPILSQVNGGTFTNAVGLSNPGAREFANELKKVYPLKNKFLLVSIFGANGEEFTETAKILEPYADGFELNVSCPHAKGYGAAIGSKKELVIEVVKAVKAAVKKPIVVKLTPNVDNIGEIAKAAVDSGADAICAINTVGPVENVDSHTKKPILTNIKGGLSGKGAKEKGLSCIREISEAVDKPIIAMGGIFSAGDVKDYEQAGAGFFGIGSALCGMDTKTIKQYFKFLIEDLENGTNHAERLTINEKIMGYLPYKIKKVKRFGEDFKVFYFGKKLRAKPGQFVFTWLPGIGEKPFSVADNNPLTLVIKKVGKVTSNLFELNEGEELMIRGPYGNTMNTITENICLVAGGCGIAPLFFFAKELGKKGIRPKVIYGAKTEEKLMFKQELEEISDLKTTTDEQGFVTDLLEAELQNLSKGAVFYNCGPEIMIRKAVELQKANTSNDKIFIVAERYTKCGVGLCGSCAVKSGLRACIDGPVFDADTELGEKRGADGCHGHSH